MSRVLWIGGLSLTAMILSYVVADRVEPPLMVLFMPLAAGGALGYFYFFISSKGKK